MSSIFRLVAADPFSLGQRLQMQEGPVGGGGWGGKGLGHGKVRQDETSPSFAS